MRGFKRLVWPYMVWAGIMIVIPMLIIVFYAFTKEGNSVVQVKLTLEQIILHLPGKGNTFLVGMIKYLSPTVSLVRECVLMDTDQNGRFTVFDYFNTVLQI